MSEVQLSWDVALRYMSLAEGEALGFGFERVEVSWPLDSGIRRLDHVAGNVTSLEEAVEYVEGFTVLSSSRPSTWERPSRGSTRSRWRTTTRWFSCP